MEHSFRKQFIKKYSFPIFFVLLAIMSAITGYWFFCTIWIAAATVSFLIIEERS